MGKKENIISSLLNFSMVVMTSECVFSTYSSKQLWYKKRCKNTLLTSLLSAFAFSTLANAWEFFFFIVPRILKTHGCVSIWGKVLLLLESANLADVRGQ